MKRKVKSERLKLKSKRQETLLHFTFYLLLSVGVDNV
jgi:hypothetical protein